MNSIPVNVRVFVIVFVTAAYILLPDPLLGPIDDILVGLAGGWLATRQTA